MITNQDSYTVSDEYEREVLTPKLPSERVGGNSFEQLPLFEPCQALLEWEDPLEERPVIFRIREYSNNEESSCTVSLIVTLIPFLVLPNRDMHLNLLSIRQLERQPPILWISLALQHSA